MKLRLLAAMLLGLFLSIAAAHAAPCNPAQSPVGSMGCQPALSPPVQGSDLFEVWRPSLFPNSLGTFTASQMATFFQTTSGFVVGPSTSTVGHIALYNNTTGTLLKDSSLTALIDTALCGTGVQGNILYRGASTWQCLATGTSGLFLETLGAGSNPAWAGVPISTGVTGLGTNVAASMAIAAGNTGGIATANVPQLLTSSSGNYTVSAGVFLIKGVMSAAGGGGGGVSAAAATASAAMPGMIISFVMVVTPGQVIAYTNGAGGTRGANTGGNGGTGGNTTFGTLTAQGGAPGIGSTSGNAVAVSLSNVPVLAMISGSTAIPTATTFITGMMPLFGGAAGTAGTGGLGKGIWGTGGTSGTNGSATDATGFGAAGSGAGSTTNTAGTGGLGAPGAIIIY